MSEKPKSVYEYAELSNTYTFRIALLSIFMLNKLQIEQAKQTKMPKKQEAIKYIKVVKINRLTLKTG